MIIHDEGHATALTLSGRKSAAHDSQNSAFLDTLAIR